jgi:hypothetical protein
MNERIKELIKSMGIILEAEHFEIVELMVDEFIQLLEQSKSNSFPSLESAKQTGHFIDVLKNKVRKNLGDE